MGKNLRLFSSLYRLEFITFINYGGSLDCDSYTLGFQQSMI